MHRIPIRTICIVVVAAFATVRHGGTAAVVGTIRLRHCTFGFLNNEMNIVVVFVLVLLFGTVR